MGKFKEKSAVLAKICMNLKELGVICGGPGIFFPKIVVRGGGNSWKSGGKFPKNGVVRGTTIREGRVVKFPPFQIFSETSSSPV